MPPLPISASLEVAAPLERVWDVVSDVTRMPEWSPELRWLYAVGGARPRLGTILVGLNQRGYAVWPTTSKVVRLEPGRVVAWKTRQSGATWTYELEPSDTGTRLSGRRDLPRYTLGTTLFAPLIGGAGGHDHELADGIRATLERMRATIEADAQT